MEGPYSILVSCSQPGNQTRASPGPSVTSSGRSIWVAMYGVVTAPVTYHVYLALLQTVGPSVTGYNLQCFLPLTYIHQ